MLLGRGAKLPQRIPASISLRLAATVAGVAVDSTARAQPSAILAAESEFRNAEQPELSDDGPQIQHGGPGWQTVSVGIVRDFVIGFDEDRVDGLVHRNDHRGQTAPTLSGRLANEAAVPVVAIDPRTGQAPRDVNGSYRPRITLQPYRVVGGQLAIDRRCLMVEIANIVRQHNP